jgi:hypothetical protein
MNGEPKILLDLSEWTRLKEVEEYAERRSIKLGKAIRELVNKALSEPEPGGYVDDWLAVGESIDGITSEKRPIFDVLIAVSTTTGSPGGLYDIKVVDRYSKRGGVVGEMVDLPSLDDAILEAKELVTHFLSSTPADEDDA